MTRRSKVLDKVLGGMADGSIRFTELRGLLTSLGFSERTKGDHHIFTREGMPEILNLQPKGSQAKNYQVKQVRQVIVKHRLGSVPDDK